MLVLWQQDLAERLASMKGQDKEDNPALKARMRDLEEEQRQVRDALARLLDDIQEHVDKLPEKPELKDLRKTAQEFVEEGAGSGASEAMAAAEAALAEFAGTRGYEKAKEAADILAKFLNECQGCKNCACNGMRLVFQAEAVQIDGQHAGQLLAGLGMGTGMGDGTGPAWDGDAADSARSASSAACPRCPASRRAAKAVPTTWRGARAMPPRPPARIPTQAAGDAVVPGQAAGVSEGAVPARYRRQVGQYFQRIAEETGETAR